MEFHNEVQEVRCCIVVRCRQLGQSEVDGLCLVIFDRMLQRAGIQNLVHMYQSFGSGHLRCNGASIESFQNSNAVLELHGQLKF
jgi:hypothetical protein